VSPALQKADIDQAVQNSTLPEVQASLCALKDFLERCASDATAATPFDGTVFLAELVTSVERLSVVTLHLLEALPLAALSEFDASSISDGSKATPAIFSVAQGLGRAMSNGHSAEGETIRSLLNVSIRLILRKHKEPLIKELLQAHLPSPDSNDQGGDFGLGVDRGGAAPNHQDMAAMHGLDNTDPFGPFAGHAGFGEGDLFHDMHRPLGGGWDRGIWLRKRTG